VGDNEKFVYKYYPDEKYYFSVTIENLQLIRNLGFEYFKENIPDQFELRFFLRCLRNLAKFLKSDCFSYVGIYDRNGNEVDWDISQADLLKKDEDFIPNELFRDLNFLVSIGILHDETLFFEHPILNVSYLGFYLRILDKLQILMVKEDPSLIQKNSVLSKIRERISNYLICPICYNILEIDEGCFVDCINKKHNALKHISICNNCRNFFKIEDGKWIIAKCGCVYN
jgi:uncharacterized protein YbaR (Trm112 family)